MPKIPVWISALALFLSTGAFAAPLMPKESFIPPSREASLLTPEELRLLENYRKDPARYRSARLFRANMAALLSEVVDVEIDGKSQRYLAWARYSVSQDPSTQQVTRHPPGYAGALSNFWTGSTSLPARGRPTAQFVWGIPDDGGLSGQFVVDRAMYTIGTIGRFHVLVADAHPLSAIPGTGPFYLCVDSTGSREIGEKPVPRCDRPQRQRDEFGDPGALLPPTLSAAEAEPFKRLHPKLRVSPLQCDSAEITHCDDLVRISCNAGGDAPVRYYDNASAELLGTCGFWVKDLACMPQRWKACAVKNGVRHIPEEPDPAR